MGKKNRPMFGSLHLSMITSLSGFFHFALPLPNLQRWLLQETLVGRVGGDEFVYHGHWSWHPLSMCSRCFFMFRGGWCVHTGLLECFWCLSELHSLVLVASFVCKLLWPRRKHSMTEITTYGLTSITTSWARGHTSPEPLTLRNTSSSTWCTFLRFSEESCTYEQSDQTLDIINRHYIYKSKPWWILNLNSIWTISSEDHDNKWQKRNQLLSTGKPQKI